MDQGPTAYRLTEQGEWVEVLPGQEYVCPVCGFPGLNRPSHGDGGSGSHEICLCCGTEFGFDEWQNREWYDDDLAVIHARLRDLWVKAGKHWWALSITAPPPGWDATLQLDRLRHDH